MAEVTFNFGAPSSTNLNDSQPFQLGVKFRTSVGKPCTGVEWRVPDTVPSAGTTISLWSAAGSRLATASVSYASGGALVKKYFAAAVNLTANTDYYASVFTPDRYVASANFTWPHTTDILTAQANNGWLQFEDIFPDTESGNDANFHVSPILEAGATITGTMVANLGALAGTIAGKRTVLGVAQASLGALSAVINAAAVGSGLPITAGGARDRYTSQSGKGYL